MEIISSVSVNADRRLEACCVGRFKSMLAFLH